MYKKEALEAFEKASSNAQLKKLGLTDEILAGLEGYSEASFAELMADLEKFASNLESSQITVENFNSVISLLNRKGRQGGNFRKGIHWIIKDIGNETTTFNNLTIKFEYSIPNARPTIQNSRIDVFCGDCPPGNLKVEYKSGVVTSLDIKEQFIERDLFNAGSPDEIQWRLQESSLSSAKLKIWMKENKSALNNLPLQKKTDFFTNFLVSDGITDSNIDNFVDSYYNTIFISK